MGCKVTGTAEITARFESLRQAMRGEAVRSAARKASNVMAREMRTVAPVLDERTANSTAQEPGVLKSSIRVSVSRPDNRDIVRALIGPNRKASRVAHLVEYGHRLVKGGKSRVGPKGAVGPGVQIGDVSAYPFLRPAYEATAQSVLETFKDEIGARLNEELK